MTKLLQLRGLPASGKTTYARSLLGKKSTWKRVNKDSIRAMIDDSHWSNKNEQIILRIRDLIIYEFLGRGFDVVVDDTNLAPSHEKRLRELAQEFSNVEFETKFFDTELQECIKRDLARPNPVGEKVIRRMYMDYLRPKYSPPPFTPGLPKAIVVDIDGTLAHSDQRSPYDPTLYHLDIFDENVADLVNRYRRDHNIIVCSGREEPHRSATEEWLAKYNFSFDHFFMRPTGDKRKDSIVKEEIFHNYIEKRYNISLVIDDRNQVIKMWRSLGLKVAQINDGDF